MTLLASSTGHRGPFDPAIFDPAVFDTGDPPVAIASVNWTGVEERLAADPATVRQIADHLRELDELVAKAGLTNSETAKAKAITGALKSLIESPEPEWKAIVELLNSPIISALCTALNLAGAAYAVIRLIVG